MIQTDTTVKTTSSASAETTASAKGETAAMTMAATAPKGTEAPKVSVIVPNYNHRPYLTRRIESILNQTFTDFELILLDDCSKDGSQQLLESYAGNPKVSQIVLNQQNSGSTFAQWKRGLALARGEYVWIAESDDFAEPTFLETLVAQLDAHPEAAMAFSGSNMVDAMDAMIPHMDWDRYRPGQPEVEVYDGTALIRRKLLWTADVYNASMVVFRREKAPEITDAQMHMRYCGDWLFWVNMALGGGGVEVRRKLNNFRQHTAKVSPGASKSGLYFIEGLPIMVHIADSLGLSPAQRRMLAGRTWKRLKKFPQLMAQRGPEVMERLERLSPGSAGHKHRLITLYELDKFLNFTGLQPK